MPITKQQLAGMLKKSAALWMDKSGELSAIDSKFGDGDHGITIKKIAALMEQKADAWSTETLYEFLDNLGAEIMGINGGSAGPLYGTMIGGMAVPLDGKEEIDEALLKQMLQASLEEMESLTTATVGDKTMMDSLIPAVNAAQKADGTLLDILKAASDAAAAGAEESKQYISKYGRAKSYKEQTIGTADAGAVSTSLLFAGLYQGYCEISGV